MLDYEKIPTPKPDAPWKVQSRRPAIDLAAEQRRARIERWKAAKEEAKWANARRPGWWADLFGGLLIVAGAALAIALGTVAAFEVDRRLHPESYPTFLLPEDLEEGAYQLDESL